MESVLFTTRISKPYIIDSKEDFLNNCHNEMVRTKHEWIFPFNGKHVPSYVEMVDGLFELLLEVRRDIEGSYPKPGFFNEKNPYYLSSGGFIIEYDYTDEPYIIKFVN